MWPWVVWTGLLIACLAPVSICDSSTSSGQTVSCISVHFKNFCSEFPSRNKYYWHFSSFPLLFSSSSFEGKNRVKEHGTSGTKQMVQDFTIISAKKRKEEYLWSNVFLFFRKISSGKVCSIWFFNGTTGFSVQMKNACSNSFIAVIESAPIN